MSEWFDAYGGQPYEVYGNENNICGNFEGFFQPTIIIINIDEVSTPRENTPTFLSPTTKHKPTSSNTLSEEMGPTVEISQRLQQILGKHKSDIENHYPKAYAHYKPDNYNTMSSALEAKDVEALSQLTGTEVVDYLSQNNRLDVKGDNAEDLRQSIARLIDGSPTFRQSLITGLAVDNSYSLYADNYDKLDSMMKDEGLDLEKDLAKMPEGEWSAFAMLDAQLKNPNGKTTNYDHPYDGFFNTDVIRQSGADFNKALDRTVAHEFGHLLLNLTDGDVGEAGSNQKFTADIMREMGYAASDDVIPTYATGGESLLVEPQIKQAVAQQSSTPEEQALLMLSMNDSGKPYFIPDERNA
jgi:hypothetical protein